MAERARRNLAWSSLSRFERLALVSTILVWMGVVLFGIGLYIALRNRFEERAAYVNGTAIALAAVEPTMTSTVVESTMTPTTTDTVTPSPTLPVLPAGWSTATPTLTPTPTLPTAIRARQKASPTPVVRVTLLPKPSWLATQQAANTQQTSAKVDGPPPASQPPDRLVIPTIRLDSAIVPVDRLVVEDGGQQLNVWQVADRVVGWHKTSAYPGHAGNVVLNGHHNIKGEVFRYLIEVKIGDRVLVYAGNQVYHYAVTEMHILKEKGEPPQVRRKNAEWIGPTEDARLTMVTCWPYTNNTHRLVVVAKPVSPPKLDRLQE